MCTCTIITPEIKTQEILIDNNYWLLKNRIQKVI